MRIHTLCACLHALCLRERETVCVSVLSLYLSLSLFLLVVCVCVCVCVCCVFVLILSLSLSVCEECYTHTTLKHTQTRAGVALPARSLLRLRSVDRYVFNPPVLTCRCWLNRWRARYRGSQIWVVFFFWSFSFLRCSQCRSSETCAWKGSRDSLV